jgi:CheY-like chemotaxis protein
MQETIDNLPPHNNDAERAALACVMAAPSVQEQEALLLQLRPEMFFDHRHKELFKLMVGMREDGHAVDPLMLVHAAKEKNLESLNHGWLAGLTELPVSVIRFQDYLSALKDTTARRWTLSRGTKLSSMAWDKDFSVEMVKSELGFLFERAAKVGETARPMIEVVTCNQIRAYIPNPSLFLVGADMISKGELTVIGGSPGLGKSRLGNTLAFAGARGGGEWMGYEIKRQFRTLVLQCENSMRRLKSEVEAVPADAEDWVRFTKPCPLSFSKPEFRDELRRIYEQWPFDVVVLDHWAEIAREEGQADHLEALDHIRASLPLGEDAPAVVIIAHMRKMRGGDSWRPKQGRELLNELSGSFAIGAKARTVFMIQPGSLDIDDDRIVFECAKSNNDQPLPPSAWHRRNGEFLPCPSFSFEEWYNPPEDGGRKVVSEADLKTLFMEGKRKLSLKQGVADLMALGFAQATAYRALSLDKSKFKDYLKEEGGLLSWKG